MLEFEDTMCRWCRRQLVLISLLASVAGCTSTISPPAKVSLQGSTTVPLQVIKNITFVYAAFNRTEGALLMVDTGAQTTVITPSVLTRLGLSIPEDAPPRQLTIFGGQTVEVPFMRVSAVQVGDAVVENLEVGVYDVAPKARFIDGLLGGDFLHQFRVMLDKTARQMRLEPLAQTEQLASPSPQMTEPYKAYSGPELPPDEVAIIKQGWEGFWAIAAVDGQTPPWRAHGLRGLDRIAVKPGKHTLAVQLVEASSFRGAPFGPLTLLFFEAEAGYTYIVRRIMKKGSPVYWIEDEERHEVVAGQKPE